MFTHHLLITTPCPSTYFPACPGINPCCWPPLSSQGKGRSWDVLCLRQAFHLGWEIQTGFTNWWSDKVMVKDLFGKRFWNEIKCSCTQEPGRGVSCLYLPGGGSPPSSMLIDRPRAWFSPHCLSSHGSSVLWNLFHLPRMRVRGIIFNTLLLPQVNINSWFN